MDKPGKSAGLRDLLAFAGPHRAAISAALALGLLGALAALAQPLLVGAVLRAFRTGGPVAGPTGRCSWPSSRSTRCFRGSRAT